MKKIVTSLAMIVFVGAVVASGTGAFFSDTETSTANVFTAGAIDLKIDSTQHYNNAVCVDGKWALEPEKKATVPQYPVIGTDCGGTWELKDLVPTSDKFFNFSDIKPGDSGENTISLHVLNNDSWACVNVIPTKNDDVTSTEPELAAPDATDNDSIFDGELAQNMTFQIWADTCAVQPAVPGDNIYQASCDTMLTSGTGPIAPTTYAIATPAGNVFTGLTNDPLDPLATQYLGVAWSVPTSVGNVIQTDTYQADISFDVVQSRNNPDFVCPNAAPARNTLRLENENIVEDGPWTIINDGTYADLTWSDGPTFDYSLNAKGLAANTNYSLIYYADGWPGNNPGAFIGQHTTDGTGAIVGGVGSPNLGIDLPALPDGNFAAGAKIWLVPSSDYNNGSLSTGPMTAWNPSQYLFEGNVYIHYNDTNN